MRRFTLQNAHFGSNERVDLYPPMQKESSKPQHKMLWMTQDTIVFLTKYPWKLPSQTHNTSMSFAKTVSRLMEFLEWLYCPNEKNTTFDDLRSNCYCVHYIKRRDLLIFFKGLPLNIHYYFRSFCLLFAASVSPLHRNQAAKPTAKIQKMEIVNKPECKMPKTTLWNVGSCTMVISPASVAGDCGWFNWMIN